MWTHAMFYCSNFVYASCQCICLQAQKQAQPKLKGRTSIFAQASRGSQAVIPLAATRAAGLRFTATPEDVIAAQLAAPREADNTTVSFADDDGRHATQQQTMTGLRISFEGAAGAYHQEDSPRLTSDSADSDRSDCSHATDDTDCSIQHSQPEDEPYDAHEERQFSSFHGQAAEAVLASRGDLWELPEEAADADMREATPASHNWPGTSSSDSLWARSQKSGASSAASSQHVSRGRSSDSGLDLEARAHQTVRWEDESITLEDKRRAKAHARSAAIVSKLQLIALEGFCLCKIDWLHLCEKQASHCIQMSCNAAYAYSHPGIHQLSRQRAASCL